MFFVIKNILDFAFKRYFIIILKCRFSIFLFFEQ